MKRKLSLSVIATALTVTLFVPSIGRNAGIPGSTVAHAADAVSVDSIVKALEKRKTRGAGQGSTGVAKEIEALKRIRKTRGWNLHDRARLANTTESLGQVDLVVYFAFDSAEIQKESEPTLDMLGKALARREYEGRTFVLAGHTDAKGSANYNQSLSERRAEAVKRYITERFKLATDDLLTVGYGFERPKDASNPLSGANRRVQVVNFN
jgi:outer membrane protein OmpA-like peptidoglycan-associated protein